MELIYPWVLYIGIPVIFALTFFFFKRNNKYKDGKRVVNANFLAETPYYKRIKNRYKTLKFSALLGLVLALTVTMFMIARPVKVETINEEAHNRDIFLCMDISDSMDYVNLTVVDQLRELVTELEGERFGISIFNGQSVLLVPLTTDYDYIMETLDTLYEVFKYSCSFTSSLFDFDYQMYYYKYEGTLCDRGSSFIGEGLASCLYSFSDLDTDPDRTRMIIFTTDNELNGDPLVTLKDAAELCTKHNVKVFSLTPDHIVEQDIFEPAMIGTGGGFFTTDDPHALDDMITAIRKTGTNITEHIKTVITDHRPILIVCTIILDVAFLLMVFWPYFLLKRKSMLHHILQGVALLLVVAINVRLMIPQIEVEDYTGDTDVLFVVDNTISMLAEDMQGGGRRIDSVKEDLHYIMEQFPGARYSVISFGNDARRLVPYTTDISIVEQAILSLNGLTENNANGTGLNAPISVMKDTLKAGYVAGNRQLVFFISDGEITNPQEQKVSNYGVLAEYIDGGLVLGYGTDEGGRMKVYSFSGADTMEYLQYYDTNYNRTDALSVIDEENLKYIAEGMKVPYIHMTDQSKMYGDVMALASELVEAGERETEDGPNIPDILYFMLLPLFPILGYDYLYIKRKL